jgi:hypothetical protein
MSRVADLWKEHRFLSALVATVERQLKADELDAAAVTARMLARKLRRRLRIEDELLGAIERTVSGFSSTATAPLRRDHTAIGARLATLEAALAGSGDDALSALRALEATLSAHHALESAVIYPMAETIAPD